MSRASRASPANWADSSHISDLSPLKVCLSAVVFTSLIPLQFISVVTSLSFVYPQFSAYFCLPR